MHLKNKGVIFTIIFILCAGVFVTNYTRRLVSPGTVLETSREEQRSAASSAGFPEQEVQSGAGTMDDQAAPALLSAEEGMPADDSELPAPVAEFQDEYEQNKEKSTVLSAVISPLTGSVESAEKNASSSAFTSEDYRKKLQDIDAQIKKMKDSGVEPLTDSYKNMAEYEYRLWDKELNTIYQDIIRRMSAEEADKLRAEEREWMNLRDQTAHKAISKYNGGTMESLEYTASMAVSTRTRTYELIEKYGGYLDYILIEITNVVE